MPVWVWVWLVILGVTAIFGFGGIITALVGPMKLFFFSCAVIFTVLVVSSLVAGRRPPARPGGWD